MGNINNEIFSDVLEQSALTVVISHLNTLKHCVAVELCHSNQIPHQAWLLRHFYVIFKSAEIPLLLKRLVEMFLVSKEHTGGLVSTHFVTFCPYVYVTSPFKD